MSRLTQAEIDYQAAKFQKEFVALVHKYAGDRFDGADPRLLIAMARNCSVFNSTVWSKLPEKP